MRCDCCGKGYDFMYRTVDTRVYCLLCATRDNRCCYGKPVVPFTEFKVAMQSAELASLEARGHKRDFVVTKPKWNFRKRE